MGIEQILLGHGKDLGAGFMVRRVLPSAQRQGVGPFLFFDHFGPVTVHSGAGHDVRPHPHIGLATVTYLFEGAMEHRDSLGFEQRIEPGAINWMTAGRGIVHSERQPDDLKHASYAIHGIQLWAALPRDREEQAPSFVHTAAATIPAVNLAGAAVKVLVGQAFGVVSQVHAFSGAVYLDLTLGGNASMDLPPLAPELALYPVDGPLEVDGQVLEAGSMGLLAPGAGVRLRAPRPVRVMLLGGEPIDGHRHMWWNFVSSRKERIGQAAEDWQAQRMGQVAGDPEWIPLPDNTFTAA